MIKKIIKIIFLLIVMIMLIIPNVLAANKVKLGDVNDDSKIDSSDLLLLTRHIVAMYNKNHENWILKDDKFKAADITKNGVVDLSDMLVLIRYIAANNNPDVIGKKHPEWLKLENDDYTPEPEPVPVQISIPETIEVSKIELNKTSITLDMSDTKTETLKAEVLPNNATDKTITWSSSNTKIATVDNNGKVTAIANGTVTITAKSANGKEVTCTATVITNPTKITLTATTKDIYAVKTSNTKNTATITVTLEPSTVTEKKITWTTNMSNNKLASIKKESNKIIITANDIGYVTGTVTITAKTTNGKTATCEVNVKPIDTKQKWTSERQKFIEKHRLQVELEAMKMVARPAKNIKYLLNHSYQMKNSKNYKSKLSYVINSAKKTNGKEAYNKKWGCSGWIKCVFRNANVTDKGVGSAAETCECWCYSTNRNDLKPGMIIAVTTTGSRKSTTAGRKYGHVGLYMGNGKVRHYTNSGVGKLVLSVNVRETSLDTWIKSFGSLVTPRWGWLGGIELENDMKNTIKN